jgi:hypoxia up-regulated 1
MNFADIKNRAGKLLAANMGAGYVKEAAISIPGHFTVAQRRAIADAVEIAGLDLIALVNDGAAVAVNMASKRNDGFSEDKEYHIIYDVGAGSTTATLVSIRSGLVSEPGSVSIPGTIIEVEGFGYDDSFGGQLLTERIREILVDQVVEKTKVKKADLLNDTRALARLWREAERVKMVLNANTETYASIESVHGDTDFRGLVTRDQFETAANDLKSSAVQPIIDALENPLVSGVDKFKVSDISSVVLTGGSSRVPFVQQALGALFEDSSVISKNVNADEAAVLGTTLRGVGVSKIFKSKPMKVVDRVLWDYDISINGERATLFPRGTELNSAINLPLNANMSAYDITLFENGVDIGTYNVTGIQDAVRSLSNDNLKTCVSDISLHAVISLTESRTLEVESVFAECRAVDKQKQKSPPKNSKLELSETSSLDIPSSDVASDSSSSSVPAADTTTTTTGTSETSDSSTATPSQKPPQPLRRKVS